MRELPTDNPRTSLIKYAALCLNKRPYFRDTLGLKLIQRAKKLKLENTGEIIAEILDDLEKSGYLDDGYLAEAYVRRQLARGYGPKIISLKLRLLHLSQNSISEIITGISNSDQLDAIKKYSEKYPNLDRYKLTQKLYSRGFQSSQINKLFDVECSED